ncbi:MAG TPA: hypothetical protein ENI23_05455 [bacterium]|nr:hypothetical protein [bacterium]
MKLLRIATKDVTFLRRFLKALQRDGQVSYAKSRRITKAYSKFQGNLDEFILSKFRIFFSSTEYKDLCEKLGFQSGKTGREQMGLMNVIFKDMLTGALRRKIINEDVFEDIWLEFMDTKIGIEDFVDNELPKLVTPRQYKFLDKILFSK